PEETEPEEATPGEAEETEPDEVTPDEPEETEPEEATPGEPEETEPGEATPGEAEETEPDEVTPDEPEETEPEEATPGEAEETEPEEAPETVYICGKEEHVHTTECYDESGVLICALEEHLHDESCCVGMLSGQEQAQVDAVAALMQAIPSLDALETQMAAYREAGDRAGLLIWLREIAAQVDEALAAYDALADSLKSYVTDIDGLRAAKTLLDALIASVAPALSDDGAYVSELVATESEILAESKNESAEEPALEEAQSKTVRIGESIRYGFDIRTESYTDTAYGEGRIRLEFILPLAQEKAVFDLEDMAWLDQTAGYAPVVATQIRQVDGENVACQVLTGYRLLCGSTLEEQVIPGAFAGHVTVSVLGMEQGEQVSVTLSAAMEHSAWDGTCPTHLTEEKRSVQTERFTVVANQPLSYESLLAQVEALEALDIWDDEAYAKAEALLEAISAAYESEILTMDEFQDLYIRVYILIYGEQEANAEPAYGTNWMALRDSGWFRKYSGAVYTALKDVAPKALPERAAVMRARAAALSAEDGSQSQVVNPGGESPTDDKRVSVSKTIAGTDLENVFDITLKVTTTQKISEVYEEPDMGVVIVMDISNTMNDNFGGVTRYAAAMTAADNFLDQFAESNSLGISKVGFVAFNTDAHEIFGMQECSNQGQADALKNIMRQKTGPIINASNYNSTHNRFTNVEAGLKRASDMLNGTNNKNKFIIFLSDGFPTTYISSGFSGYDPYTGSGTIGSDGVFYDHVRNKYCTYGTSYSETAAIRAREMAETIRGNGTTIFSIGVDVGGQTIQKYIDGNFDYSDGTPRYDGNGVPIGDDFSVIEYPFEGTWSYEIRGKVTYNLEKQWEIGSDKDPGAYKNWLKTSIGSGYYYDSTDSDGLTAAFNEIFAEIKHQVQEGSVADWVANDPLPSFAESAETVEFIGFYDKTPELVFSNLTGSYEEGGENTASYVGEKAAISWDLKHSGYQTSTIDGTTTYTYQLVYRVRLKNENGVFVEGAVYPTNDRTTLQYRTIQGTDGNLTVSDPQTVDFLIPSVKGYLSELRFTKVDTQGGIVPGAEFLLSHDTSTCDICRGDGTSVTVADQTQTSGQDGSVSFTNIPSGHTYTLEETKVPDGYLPNNNTYTVTVAYDKITVTVRDADGKQVAWDGKFPNGRGFELPETGGTGILLYVAGGMLLTAAGALLLYHQARRRREDRSSS
ncbi:MAG: VWA domain-containing protein, partial [Candidatus Ventricola sp.]